MARSTVIRAWRSVAWGNPYTDPPAGLPRLVAEVDVPDPSSPTPSALSAVFEAMGGCGSGWAVKHGYELKRIQWSEETKQRVRRGRLRRRLEKECPLFVEDEYQRVLESRPTYYGEDSCDAE